MATEKKASTKKKTVKKTLRKTKPKVETVDKTISALHLKCTNCGEEEEKVLYCEHCDAPLEIKDVKEKDDEDVENDDGGDKEVEDLVGGTSESVDSLIDTGGLTNIFGDGGESVATSDDGDDDGGKDMSLSDMVSTLDDE